MHKIRSIRVRFLWTTVLAVMAGVWLAFAYWLVPFVIAKAYRGESLSIFNHLIRGQANYTVAVYLGRWSWLASKLSFGLIVLGVYILLAMLSLTKEATVEPGKAAGKVMMSRRRLWVVYGLGALIFGGAIFDLVRDTDDWPFSPYSMFSDVSLDKTYSMLRLYGVVQRSPLVEVPLDNDLYLQPFDNSRLSDALEHALQQNRLDETVGDCLTRYEALRRAGRHDGPPLVAIRLYRVTWTLDPYVTNIERPDRKDLLAEVVSGREGAD